MSIGINLFAENVRSQDKSYMDIEALNRLLADNLTTLMKEKNLNRSAWAKEAGLSHTGVRDIISGKVKDPRYGTLVKLADVAGVDVRRITIGPGYQEVEQADAEIIETLHQLEPAERRFLLNAAKAQVAANSQFPEQSGEDEQ